MVLNKYAAVAVSILMLVFNSLQTAIVGGLEPSEVVQLVVVFAGAIATYFVPLTKGSWAAGWKVSTALVAAVGAALAPLLVGGNLPTSEQWITVIIAGIAALGVQVGVDARKTVIDAGTATAGTPVDITNAVQAVDPEGVKAVTGASAAESNMGE